MDANEIDSDELRNLLMFYGEGGVDKSKVSEQLERWLVGDSTVSPHWGSPPDVRVDAATRWDMKESQGGLDPILLLSQLRGSIGQLRTTWPAFDLPFSLLYRARRPGEDPQLRTPRGGGYEFLGEIAGGLGGDLFTLGGTAGSALKIARIVVQALKTRHVTAKLLEQFTQLPQLLEDCERASQMDTEAIADLCGRIAFMLTHEIERLGKYDVSKRPTIVVFVDHMERPQLDHQLRTGEAVLSRLVSRQPNCLFVVTGRRSLRWHEFHPDLAASGPGRWPLL